VDADVVIAGAGPAGVSTAVALARRGVRRVLVLDRASFPRSKPCGGGLTGHCDEAMAALGLSLTVPSFPSPNARVRFGAEVRTVELGRPVKVVRREEFDASLVAQARALGVEVREKTPLDGFTVEEGGVTVGAGGRRLRARVLVGADGVGSLVRKRLVPRPGDVRPIRLFRLEIEAPRAVDEAMLYDFTPMADGLRGYLWIFPVPGGRLNVGLMHYPGPPLSGGELTALLGRHLAAHGISLPGAARGWPAWGYSPSTTVSGPHLLLVGDAAGIDALTGEGIAVGMEQGLVAGNAVAEALDRGRFGFAGYRRALRRATVGRELALDRWLARLLYSTGPGWRRWLSLVLYDDKMLELYAARVSGSLVLADHKRELVKALARHILTTGSRRRALLQSETSLTRSLDQQ
jgi:geranylgeranyl reductase family protein